MVDVNLASDWPRLREQLMALEMSVAEGRVSFDQPGGPIGRCGAEVFCRNPNGCDWAAFAPLAEAERLRALHARWDAMPTPMVELMRRDAASRSARMREVFHFDASEVEARVTAAISVHEEAREPVPYTVTTQFFTDEAGTEPAADPAEIRRRYTNAFERLCVRLWGADYLGASSTSIPRTRSGDSE